MFLNMKIKWYEYNYLGNGNYILDEGMPIAYYCIITNMFRAIF